MNESEYIHFSHNVSNLVYHFVCPTKYRRVVIDEHVDKANQMILKVINRRRPTSRSLIDTFKEYVNSSNKVISDSLRLYHKLQKEFKYEWIKIPSGKISYMGYILDEINQLHGNLKMFLSCYRGDISNLFTEVCIIV